MHRILCSQNVKSASLFPVKHLYLALAWCIGLLLGLLFTVWTGNSVSWMREAAKCPMSIVGLFASVYLPFLITAFAVFIRSVGLLYFLSAAYAFRIGWLGLSTVLAFGSAGWLIWLLMHFSSLAAAPVYYLFCGRHLSGSMIPLKRDLLFATVGVCIIGTMDLCVVSPFLVSLIEN